MNTHFENLKSFVLVATYVAAAISARAYQTDAEQESASAPRTEIAATGSLTLAEKFNNRIKFEHNGKGSIFTGSGDKLHNDQQGSFSVTATLLFGSAKPDITLFDNNTTFFFQFGGLKYQGRLGDDPVFAATGGTKITLYPDAFKNLAKGHAPTTTLKLAWNKDGVKIKITGTYFRDLTNSADKGTGRAVEAPFFYKNPSAAGLFKDTETFEFFVYKVSQPIACQAEVGVKQIEDKHHEFATQQQIDVVVVGGTPKK